MYLLLSAAGGKDKDMYFNQLKFGKRLQECRKLKELTQEELAALVGVEKQHISRIERGVTAWVAGLSKQDPCFYIGNATASRYSFERVSINVESDDLSSSLCVHNTQEKASLQSNGIQANCPL